jgi:antitoxin VapB
MEDIEITISIVYTICIYLKWRKRVMTTAKVFMSGNSQAIRLPKEFRVEGDEVYIKKTKNSIVITMKEKKEVFRNVLDDVFGCCPDFDTGRDKINDKPREVLL